MIPNANARHFRLKAALRDLIAACGGIERTAALSTLGKSTVGRWQDPDAKDFPNVAIVAALEAECGVPSVSRAMAELAGLPVGTRSADIGQDGCIMASHAQTVGQAAQLMAEGAMAFADNHVSPSEANALDRVAQKLERDLSEYRKILAGIRGEGGLSLVKGDRA